MKGLLEDGMRKEDMNTAELFLEAAGIVAMLACLVLQVCYCSLYGLSAVPVFMNLAVMILVYAGLCLLQIYPERVNRLKKEACTGDIRIYTIRMARTVKLIVVFCLLFTSILDVIGQEIYSGNSLMAVVCILAVVFYYESKIYRIIRDISNKKD